MALPAFLNTLGLMLNRRAIRIPWIIVLVVALAACGLGSTDGSDELAVTGASEVSTEPTEGVDIAEMDETVGTTVSETPESTSSTFTAEIWADNWFALSVNGELIGIDSVPITTERSFNAETLSFEASYPLTIAVEARDFIETDSGLEYIGESNQQMGDGGIIVQITDDATGEVVAVSSSAWAALVVHQAPLNADCVDDADPDTTCEYRIIEIPSDWTSIGFEDSEWARATEWSSAEVDPKGGYDEIDWDPSAQFIWGSDLEVDNTVLLRLTVTGS